MDKIRAIVDGKEVFGWYRYHPYYESHQLMVFVPDESRNCYGGGSWQENEIDLSTAAVATGRKDNKDVEIFGSKGEMQGGDKIRIHGHGTAVYRAAWSERDLQWILHDYAKKESFPLYAWNPDELEILPKAPEEADSD